MYRHLFLLFCCVATGFHATGQSAAAASGTELTAKLEALRALVPTQVTAGRDEIDQVLTSDAAKPYILTVTQTEALGKRTSSEVASINLALVRRVRLGDFRGDRLPVTIYGTAENILISEDDGGRQSYEADFDLLASSTDNARAIVSVVEELLPLAKAAYERTSAMPADAGGLQRFIAERVRTVEAGRERYEQTLTFDEAAGTGTLKNIGGGVRDEETETIFILADLQERALKLDARSGLVTLSAPVRRGREYVQVESAGRRDFDDEVVLRFSDYGDAQLASEALSKLVNLAAERAKASTPALGSTAAASALLQAAFAKTDLPDASQQLVGECSVTLSLATSGRTSGDETFAFDFADIDARAIEVRGRTGYVSLELNTQQRADFVKHTQDGELKGFERKVELRFTEATAVRDALAAVEYLAANCPAAVGTPSLAEAIGSANVKRFDEGDDEQVLAKADQSDCAYVLTLTERTGSKLRETQTTFSLRDLDARTGTLKVQGAKAYVTYGTRRREKIVDVVRDGGPQRYEDEVSIRFADVQAARAFQAAFGEAIKGCE